HRPRQTDEEGISPVERPAERSEGLVGLAQLPLDRRRENEDVWLLHVGVARGGAPSRAITGDAPAQQACYVRRAHEDSISRSVGGGHRRTKRRRRRGDQG